MVFKETPIPGLFLVEFELNVDSRGYFARTWCQREFAKAGLKSEITQTGLSLSKHKATIRGLHYQAAPMEQAKVVLCIRGRFFDVIVDIRPKSPSYGKWHSIVLEENDGRMIYIPEGCAHGFQTLENDTIVSYQFSEFHSPEHERGLRWNDPKLAIKWPLAVTHISDRDQNHPYL